MVDAGYAPEILWFVTLNEDDGKVCSDAANDALMSSIMVENGGYRIVG